MGDVDEVSLVFNCETEWLQTYALDYETPRNSSLEEGYLAFQREEYQ